MATQKQIAFAASNNTRRPVSSIPGIGPANAQYLNNHGYYTASFFMPFHLMHLNPKYITISSSII